MNDELAQHVLEQILVAVECLHQENIIHRDLKLENVLLSVDDATFQQFQHKQIDAEQLIRQGKIRIIDLGVSQVVKKLTQTYTGSPYTMAPEITKGLEYGNLVDIFSIGTIFFQLLTGKFLYSQPNFQKYINEPSTIRKDQRLKDKPELPYALLEMMINEKPENRSSAGQILNEIRKHSPQVQEQQIVNCLPKSNKDQNENHQPNPVKERAKIKQIFSPVESPQKTQKQNPNLAYQSLEFNLDQIPSVYEIFVLEQSRIKEDVQSIEQVQPQRKAKLRPNYQTELSPQEIPLYPDQEPQNKIQNIDNDFSFQAPQKTEKQNPNLAHQSLDFNLDEMPSSYKLPDLEQSWIEEDVQSIEQVQSQTKGKLRLNYQTELQPQKIPLYPEEEPQNRIQNIDNNYQFKEILSQQGGNINTTEMKQESNNNKSSIVPIDQGSNIRILETKQPNKHATTAQYQCQVRPQDTQRVLGSSRVETSSSDQQLLKIDLKIIEYEQRRDLYQSIGICHQTFSSIKNVTQTKFKVGLFFARNEAKQLYVEINNQLIVITQLQQGSRFTKIPALLDKVETEAKQIDKQISFVKALKFWKKKIEIRSQFQIKCKKVLKLLANEEARYIQGIQVVNQLSLYNQMVRLIRLLICYEFTNISPEGINFERLLNSQQKEDRETVYQLLIALDLGIQTNIFNNWVLDKDCRNDTQRQKQEFYDINQKSLLEPQPQSNKARTDLDNLKQMQMQYQLLSRTYLSLLKLQGTLSDINFAEHFFSALPFAIAKARELKDSMDRNTNEEIRTWINQQLQCVESDLDSLINLQSYYKSFSMNFRDSEPIDDLQYKFLSIFPKLAYQESTLLYQDSPFKRDVYLALANTLYLCIAYQWLPVGPDIVDLEEQTNFDNLLARSEIYQFLILNGQLLGIKIEQFEGWLKKQSDKQLH